MTMRKLKKYLPESAAILDLGGAAGAYTFPWHLLDTKCIWPIYQKH